MHATSVGDRLWTDLRFAGGFPNSFLRVEKLVLRSLHETARSLEIRQRKLLAESADDQCHARENLERFLKQQEAPGRRPMTLLAPNEPDDAKRIRRENPSLDGGSSG